MSLLTLTKRKREYQFGEVKDVEVGSRFDTKYEMKVKCLHVSDRNIHHIKVGALSLIVSPTNRDFGDIISICIPEKRRQGKISKKVCKVSNSFHENLISFLPIRVIRSAIGGQYSPIVGYRYDGLYRVENACDELCLDTQIIYHNFDLIRQAGQPTVYEQPQKLPLLQPVSKIEIKSDPGEEE